VGLLGGSLGLALKTVSPTVEIVGIGRSEQRLQLAQDRNAIDAWTCQPDSINPPLDALVVCTPVRLAAQTIRTTLPSLKPDALITDVGSTKATLVHACEDQTNGRARFVGSHPMAGSHESGILAAKADLFEDKICIVTETESSDPDAVEAISKLWRSIGMRVVRMTPEEHDRLTAFSSHLPHLTASALCQTARAIGETIEPVLGTGFHDTTRIAAGDPTMWLDICFENRERILDSIDSMTSVLGGLRRSLETKDEGAVLEFLRSAYEWKKRFPSG